MSDIKLDKNYSPAKYEKEVSNSWVKAELFSAPVEGKEAGSFSVVIPPPNVTAPLHLGHALNNTLQDTVVRYHRLKGFSTLWMAGTDHAGISTQSVVEKRLLRQGIRRQDLGREAFVEKTQEWKDEYEQVITDQLHAMGASCDWQRMRFTMDEICSNAVRHAFYELFKDGLIYRGKRLVNWDPATQTALSDDEVEMQEVDGYMYYLRYPLSDGSGSVTVATTRPETMFGDTAVAVNPNDPRAGELVGKTVVLPIVGRVIPIVADDYVVMSDPESSDAKAQYATGFLKVTPAHDINDAEIGLRHNLEAINIFAADASISAAHGWSDVSAEAEAFLGLSREQAREAVVEWLKANGYLDGKKPYSHSVGHSYRSHVAIEPWLSDQWFVAVTDDRLKGEAIRSQDPSQVSEPTGSTDKKGDGDLKFYPSRYAKTFRAWHDNIRDWCISRQLWWGHQIPVWMKRESLSDSVYSSLLSETEIDSPIVLNSEWSTMGAVHVVRKSDAENVEEAICIPSQVTLDGLEDISGKLSEADLTSKVESAGYVRDEDVLDTWFSSALWPMSTMGWPQPNSYPETQGLFDLYNPTSVLMTAREIITLWVSRMTMFSRYFLNGQLPFKDVFIHAMIQDNHGQKMSKSLGNGVDPRDIIFSHGADAMRYALVDITTDTQDVKMPVDLVCPHSGETFTPEYITTSDGYVVAAPEQVSPADPDKKMVTLYGEISGIVEPSDEKPLARNSSSKFDAGRNFVNKLWNASRFVLSKLETTSDLDIEVDLENDGLFIDRWIMSRLQQTVESLEKAMESYQFSVITQLLYDFIWRDLCDVYLEAVKPTLESNPKQKVILSTVFDSVLRILHPVCPFVTEVLWEPIQSLQKGSVVGVDLSKSEFVANSSWPKFTKTFVNSSDSELFTRLEQFVTSVRNVRAENNVKPSQKVNVHVTPDVKDLLDKVDGVLDSLVPVSSVEILNSDAPDDAVAFIFEGDQAFISNMMSAGDVESEKKRLEKQISEVRSKIDNLEKRLSNENYINKAKPELVEDSRSQLQVSLQDLEALENRYTSLVD